ASSGDIEREPVATRLRDGRRIFRAVAVEQRYRVARLKAQDAHSVMGLRFRQHALAADLQLSGKIYSNQLFVAPAARRPLPSLPRACARAGKTASTRAYAGKAAHLSGQLRSNAQARHPCRVPAGVSCKK